MTEPVSVFGRVQRLVLDAIPSVVFLLDESAHILDANRAAVQLLGERNSLVLRKLCGDVLLCVHAHESEGGCGTTDSCKTCQVRQGVTSVAAGQQVERKLHRMRLELDGREREFSFLVSASPMELDGRSLALLVLEDVTELMTLREIVPICMHCKKVRNDKQYWENVEVYLTRKSRLDFSHGICPDCEAEHFPPEE